MRVTEEQIIQGCRNADREAQHHLYVQTSDRVYNLLVRLTGDPETAFDLTQDTYIKVFTNITYFKGDSKVITWIYRIAINEARQLLRRNKNYDRKLHTLPPSSIAQANGTEASETAMDIREALTNLPEFERNLVVLRHFDSLSYDELAKVLERPEGTIGSALNRARRMLRDLLESKSAEKREDMPTPGHL